ncbi:MAG: hypothetical protein ACOZBH_02525 [Patescibacteria group bacterium]
MEPDMMIVSNENDSSVKAIIKARRLIDRHARAILRNNPSWEDLKFVIEYAGQYQVKAARIAMKKFPDNYEVLRFIILRVPELKDRCGRILLAWPSLCTIGHKLILKHVPNLRKQAARGLRQFQLTGLDRQAVDRYDI